MTIKCDPRAYAKCPDRERCGPLHEACYTAGSDCESFNEKVTSAPQTNADRIRAMRDEELCKFLGEYKFCDICEEGCDSCTYNGDCDKRLLEWLKQPAEQFREVTKMVEEVQP